MAHLKWVLGVSAALFLLPIAAAFLLQPKLDDRPTVLVGNSNTAPQANTEAGEVFVASGSPIEVPNAPIQLLMTALKSHSAARRFRITWSYNAFNYFSDETAIYDRKARRLALFVLRSSLLTTTAATLISCSQALKKVYFQRSSHDIWATIKGTLGDTLTT